jgi:hypothetical protein
MSCATCIKVDCTETSSLPKYIGGYSLSNGTFSQNSAPITVTINTPNGPTTITFPPGTIQVSIPSPVPTTPFTFVATYKQCNASYTIEIPPTQSAEFFDQVIAALARQLGDCLAESATPGGGTMHQYVNSPQTISCPGGAQMLLCNESLSFPQGITFNSSGSGSLSIIGGVVVATTLASANAGAIQLLQSFLTNMLNSANMVCGGPCPQTCAQQLAALTWTIVNGSTGTGTASGSAAGNVLTFAAAALNTGDTGLITFSATIVNTRGTPCVYNLSLSASSTLSNCFRISNIVNISIPNTVSTASPPNICAYQDYNVGGSTGGYDYFPGTLTVPPNSSVNLELTVSASSIGSGSVCNPAASTSGSMTIS